MEVTRADLAAALTGVTATYGGAPVTLTGYAYQPPSLAMWQAWPDWQAATWLTGCLIERTWQIFVILPAPDAAGWTEATDAILNAVRDALIPLGQVQRAEPIALVAADQGTTMPAVAFTVLTS